MTAIFQFNGIYTPIVTPYRDDGTVHWDALADVVDFLLAAGVHGVGRTGRQFGAKKGGLDGVLYGKIGFAEQSQPSA